MRHHSDVVIVDYGIGNLLSVKRGFEQVGADVVITADHTKILSASRVVLPGVGAFGPAMAALNTHRLIETIIKVADKGTPILGICLGMQLLLDESDEFGKTQGIGLISGKVIPIPNKTIAGDALKIPHIGWNTLESDGHKSWTGTILETIKPEDAVYFVHSFMAAPASETAILASCRYGDHLIPAIISKENIIGCQFHVEKSGPVGLNILDRFLRL